MGKGVFLLLGAAMISATYLMIDTKQNTFESHDKQAKYEYVVLARDIAESGYNEALSSVHRNLMDAEAERNGVGMLGGSYDKRVITNMYGDLNLEIDGVYDNVEHKVRANVIFESPFTEVVALSDTEVDVHTSGSSVISGMDWRAPSRGTTGGFLHPTFAIRTEDMHKEYMRQALAGSRIIGEGNEDGSGDPSIEGGMDKAFYEALYQEARSLTDTYIDSLDEASLKQSRLQSAANASSPGNPKIVRVTGDLYVNYAVNGHGILLIEDGDFQVNTNDFRWEGLVLVRKENEPEVAVRLYNEAEIYGALAAYSMGEATTTIDCAAEFEIDGNNTIVEDSVKIQVKVLGAAISYGGSYDMPVTARLKVGGQIHYPFGSWSQPVSSNINTGNSGTIHTWEPDTIYPPGTSITIEAASWQKRSSHYSGNYNSHWNTFMVKYSNNVDSQLAVLEDGSNVPNVGGYLGQYSVEDFVGDYIDQDAGEMTLDTGQSIYLFELGSNNPSSSAHDMQDLVVLVTMTKVENGTPCSEEQVLATNSIEFRMGDDAKIMYSPEALAKLGQEIDIIKDRTRVVVAYDEGLTTSETLSDEVFVEWEDEEEEEEPEPEPDTDDGDDDDDGYTCWWCWW